MSTAPAVQQKKEMRHVTRFELLMDAGFGAQKAGDILVMTFAKMGKYVYIEPMIPAEISPPPRSKPALSGVVVRLADFDITNIGNDTDLILAAHEIVLDRRLDDDETNPNCQIILDMGDKEANPESYEQVCKRIAKMGYKFYCFCLQKSCTIWSVQRKSRHHNNNNKNKTKPEKNMLSLTFAYNQKSINLIFFFSFSPIL